MAESGVCIYISDQDGVWYYCDVLYAVLYASVSCFVVRGCAISRSYIDLCNCDILSVVNVYFDHLKLWVVYINGRRYVYCSEYNVAFNECNERMYCEVNFHIHE